jgi:hypothetical protein
MGTQVFKILPDGNTEENKTEGSIKDILKTEECYVIVSDEYRKVYLWKGIESNVRSKFIGAKRSQDIRGQVGMHFGVVPLDEGEEDPDFIKLIGGKTEGGIAKAIKAEERPVARTGPAVHPLREKNVFGTPEPAAGMNIAGSRDRATQNTVQTFLGEKQVSKEISKVGAIPEGVFFAEDYSPRILSENGKILAIEFLKRTSGPMDVKVEYKSKKEILKNQIKSQLEGT